MTGRQVNDVEAGIVERARKVLPAGGFGNVTFDMVVAEGRAGHVWDESGNEYIDYLLGSGPMLVGHCHPDVTAAVQAQVAKGSTFFANNAHGIELAEAIVDAVPCAEKVRFVSSGSEATFYAMRTIRAHTGRDKILMTLIECGVNKLKIHCCNSRYNQRQNNNCDLYPVEKEAQEKNDA